MNNNNQTNQPSNSVPSNLSSQSVASTVPATKTLSNLEMMEKIASNDQSLEDIQMLTSSKITDQLKVFLVAQARNELTRVIKLTQFLDTVENNFMGKVTSAMTDDSLTLKQYGDVIGIMTSLLMRSNEIISRVLNDDSLMTILNTTIYTTDSSVQTTSVVTQLKDAQSRERVRLVLQQIIKNTENYNPETYVNPEYTDNTEEKEGDYEDGCESSIEDPGTDSEST